jgi:uncharacterized SAM-dependent methyltransferase
MDGNYFEEIKWKHDLLWQEHEEKEEELQKRKYQLENMEDELYTEHQQTHHLIQEESVKWKSGEIHRLYIQVDDQMFVEQRKSANYIQEQREVLQRERKNLRREEEELLEARQRDYKENGEE